MKARQAFIFTADAILAFYLITVILSVLLLLSYTPKVYAEQSRTIAGDALTVMGVMKFKNFLGDLRYPYANSLLYVSNNSESAWSMFLRTIEHNASVASVYPTSSSIWWLSEPGLGRGGVTVYSSPIVYNGRILAASRNGTYLLDENTGSVLWYLPIPADSTPAVRGGRIFLGSTNNNVYSIDESSGIVWNLTVGGEVVSSPVIHNGKVFVGSTDKWLYAFDEYSGNMVWFFVTSGSIRSSPAVYDNKVFVFSDDGVLYAVDENSNTSVWKYDTSQTAGVGVLTPSPAVSNGIVYFGNLDKFYALNATDGTLIWSVTFPGGDIFTSSPVVENDTVYVGYSHGLCKINASGSLEAFNLGPRISSSPIISNDVLIVSAENGDVMLMRKNDTQLIWQYSAGTPIYSSPALVNGRIYITSANGSIYSFGNCTVWDGEMSISDTIAAFLLIQKKECARALAKEFLESAIPHGYGFELVMKSVGVMGVDCNDNPSSWDSIYTNDCNQSRYQRILVQDSRYLSGIMQKGNTIYHAPNNLELELRIWN
jgi:outer membrane protein assembly factor BamB